MLHECPHCHEKIITTRNKALAGSLSAKGTKCPKCGRFSVNDASSTYFRSAITLLVFVYACLVFSMVNGGYLFKFSSTLGLLILSRLLIIGFDALFPKLIVSLRI